MKTSADFINQAYGPALLDFYKSLDSPVLMEGGVPIHRAKTAAKWKETKGINKMSWPAQSPDLNPIENLWSMMKKRINAFSSTNYLSVPNTLKVPEHMVNPLEPIVCI
ncbi:hypothetical protein G6F70_005524 [Rhizopus microsporus]|nr:hypothetical protein G6F71_005377 [Rhizopus microsporus]KAG1198759.1 hypothetical protein G6F70_005524 [Rhizopus microsporus]KAG1210553.1 hypothetical protein G6F69_005379 [Rhizopus microsporus]KAG1232342.1 hypothetical protein G6F67_005088 [Rhizopus microsporus]KAG1261327.1 hypothetical protein G6F68_006765 [Rhizopus microsporus]